ncbi:MAG: hypothetical protein LBK62_02315 [Treponema sp.]|jgi:hypothetical protein|nr:hypothetical protein [Treponema sp.]
MAKEPNKSLFSKLFSRLPVKLPGKYQAPVEAKPGPPALALIFFIVDWNRSTVISSVCEEEKVRIHFVAKGRGTASSDILDLLGIGASDKAVMLCLEQEVMAPVLLKEVRKKLGFHSPGAGIAFTVPLSGINSPILRVFKQSVHKNEKLAEETAKGETMAGEYTHDLIISVVNQGYSNELMSAAKGAGATGGTVLNARSQAHQGSVKFFGVSVQDEREVIVILTNREKKAPIMRAICEACGLNSKAEGIVFSMPVDTVMGLSFE